MQWWSGCGSDIGGGHTEGDWSGDDDDDDTAIAFASGIEAGCRLAESERYLTN
jgi:hypothetical protein